MPLGCITRWIQPSVCSSTFVENRFVEQDTTNSCTSWASRGLVCLRCSLSGGVCLRRLLAHWPSHVQIYQARLKLLNGIPCVLLEAPWLQPSCGNGVFEVRPRVCSCWMFWRLRLGTGLRRMSWISSSGQAVSEQATPLPTSLFQERVASDMVTLAKNTKPARRPPNDIFAGSPNISHICLIWTSCVQAIVVTEVSHNEYRYHP